MALVSKLDERKSALVRPLFNTGTRYLNAIDDCIDESVTVLVRVTVKQEAHSRDFIYSDIKTALNLAQWWTEWYPLPSEKRDLLLNSSRTCSLPINNATKVTSFEDSVVGSEVMMTNDLTRLKRTWTILPLCFFRRDEAGNGAVIGRYGFSNFD